MGEYNPHLPQTLGQEWVPIREEDTQLSGLINPVEYGHSFELAQTRTLSQIRYYANDGGATAYNPSQVLLGAIYPKGLEAATGPIKRVLIPVNNGGTTGTGITVAGGSVAVALASPEDGLGIQFVESGVVQQQVSMFFAVNNYPDLFNKRILAVNLRYVFWEDPRSIATSTLPSFVGVLNNAGLGTLFGNLSDHQGDTSFDQDGASQVISFKYGTMRFGELDRHWNAGTFSSSEVLPWTYTGLQKFEASNANRIYVRATIQLNASGNTSATSAILNYAALEVLYCEEQRLVVGGASRSNVGAYVPAGVAPLTARVMGTYGLSPALNAGQYTVTISSPEQGDLLIPLITSPKLNALREFYAIPPHHGVQVNIPAPVDDTKLGEEFTSEQTHVLPQITVHTSGGPLTEVHVYGRQAVAQVYGTITATQEILDSAAGGARSWPQVRYYARRFGNTTTPLVLDSPTITGSGLSVRITPNEFDALDEIIDGWKQVTLRFDTAPVMGAGTNPQWRWSATGETAGNRWEVLGCTAPALSGLPGNLLNPVASPHQLSNATYGAPSAGSTINMGWVPQYAPAVTATADDQTSDAVLIFAQDMLPVTGMTVTMTSQPVSGIGFDCGATPCCIPSAIQFNRVQWSPVTGSLVLLDTYTRAVTGWGTTDTGQTYTDTGGTTPGNYVVNGSEGTHILDGVANVARISVITGSYTDSHQEVVASINVTPAGASIRTALIGHYVDANNFDAVDFRWATNGSLEIVIANIVAGVQTGLTNFNAGPFIAGQQWHLVADFVGTTIRAKAWFDGATEPDGYQVSAAAAFTSGGIGVRSIRSTGNTNTDAVTSYDDYTVGPSTWNFGSYELQRMDELTDWETIMAATDPRTVQFDDFEARVGLESDYRIRAVDVYDFAGPWSDTVSETIDSPGVTIAESCSGGHLLIFTSNSVQDGTANLAYSTVWETAVNEDFDFPEAGDVILQKMYGKDFVTAFRPLERGGERFSRTVLVQAAAIDPETLGDFTDLRDLAWAQLPYVCVRDEDGNRWFATVLVPSGRVQLNRTLYMAPITVMEVTDTPFPVDP